MRHSRNYSRAVRKNTTYEYGKGENIRRPVLQALGPRFGAPPELVAANTTHYALASADIDCVLDIAYLNGGNDRLILAVFLVVNENIIRLDIYLLTISI